MKKLLILLALYGFMYAPDPLLAQKKSGWQLLNSAQKDSVFKFTEEYKGYVDKARTELSSTAEILRYLRAEGFQLYSSLEQIRPGARLIFNNRDRALIAAVIGRESITRGSRLLAAHHDSPRIDLKARPLYEREGFAMFQTILYGGIKKYHWANLPLMLSGRIDTKEGKTILVESGRDINDPVLIIPDAAPHVDSPLRNRTYTGVLDGEELDPVIGSIAGEKSSVQSEIMQILQRKYNITEDDFVSAELNLVPATPPRDIGLDRGMIGAYGQDDRVCSYAAIRALAALKNTPAYTGLVYLADNEETGNVNNTGAASTFLTNTYARIAQGMEKSFTENSTRDALRASLVISADANDGISPLFPELSEKSNAARLGYGVAIKRYGRSFDANSEFTARIRAILDGAGIPWQTASYKVETGGGGTIGGQMSREDMEVIDIGIPLLSMHSPFEIASKADIWNLYRFMSEFLKYAE
jgi:aspartyl aminopeptidase